MAEQAHKSNPLERTLEKQLRYESALVRLALLVLGADSFETTLQVCCGVIAEILDLRVVLLSERDWSLCSSLTIAKAGNCELEPGAGHGLVGLASTAVGQVITSELADEARYRVEPELIAAGLGFAMALCSGEVNGTTSIVLAAFSSKPKLIDSEEKAFFSRAADILTRAVHQQREQAELRKRNARYTSFFEGAGDAIFCIATDGQIQDVNPDVSVILGYTRDELLSMNLFDVLSTESQAMARKMIDEKIAVRRRTIYESTFVDKSGASIPVEVNSSMVRDCSGELIGIQGIVRDLRSRKIAEQALIVSENRFRSVVESEMIGIVFWDAEARITDANRTFLSMLGYSQIDIDKGELHWDAITPAEDLGQGRTFTRRLQAEQKIAPFETECIQKNGGRVPVLIGGATLQGTENGGVGFVLDITERKQLQRQFQHAQKMEAVGQLAAGIAHDFNNILMGISSFAELLHVMSASDPKKQQYTQQILAAAARAAELVEQLLVFSAKRAIKPESVNLVRTLQESRNLLRQILGPKCELQMDLISGSCNVIGDPVQLEQVILNLASNARDAMSKGGTFRVSLAKVKFLKPEENQKVLMPAGSYALLTFCDTGVGIKPELIGRIFEPFFTTKPTGEGTGLGLAMVYGIVKQCGGYIFVESEQGVRTVFRLFLPLTVKQTLTSAKAPQFTSSPVEGVGILLVDDELQIRLSCADYLRNLGYEVFEAPDAKVALELFNANLHRIKIVVTDVVMPGMGGKELAMELKQRNPALAILFMSGYTANSGAGLEEISAARTLAKPVALGDLSEAVTKALQNSAIRSGS